MSETVKNFINKTLHAPIMRRVMQEFYQGPGPASTAVGTSGLFFPDLLVEIDVTAVSD